jgi:hypothetical protein
MEYVSELLSEILAIQMSAGKRQIGIDECVKLMSTPLQHASVCVTGVRQVVHISLLTSDLIWVRDDDDLILTDGTGLTMHHVTDLAPFYTLGGVHTVNSYDELIYIDRKYNIIKVSADNTSVITLLKRPSPWRLRCVYCSPITGYLMVGMLNRDAARVILYSDTLEHILTIQNDNAGHGLYGDPLYITENKNGDIIVSDLARHAVVVTDSGGRHRFSYSGPSSESSIQPRGICTDALSHILVCDLSGTVQMIDKDGQFLSLLLTMQPEIYKPYGIAFDNKTHLLWVGSCDDNTVRVYRYIQRRYSLTGKY